MRKKTSFLFLLITFSFASISSAQDYYIVKIYLEDKVNFERLSDLNLDPVSEEFGDVIEVVAPGSAIDAISQRGFEYEIVRSLTLEYVPDYPSYQETVVALDSFALVYPAITEIYVIGESHELGYPIYAIKVSDNAHVREDETVVWLDGVHHAREPMGMMSCMVLLEHLLDNYGSDPDVTALVDSLEIWIVPILNTEGYVYFIEGTNSSPWWRKNFHDNNSNGVFDFNYDGVDLNRNYDLWFTRSNAGSPNPASWVYRGEAPFSEKETQAKRNLVQFLRPISSISYHSYGEIIYYRSGANGHPIPETGIIENFGGNIANHINRIGSGTYANGPGYSNSPMSYPWMFIVNGTWEFLIETGNQFVPSYGVAQAVAADNLPGALYLLGRSLAGPGIRGHVVSSGDGSPVDAIVKIFEYHDQDLVPRRTELTFGRYNRFAEPGSYTLEVSSYGFKSQLISNVAVNTGWTEVEVNLLQSSAIGIIGTTIDDDMLGMSRGNGDSLAGAGEQIELDVTLFNSGVLTSGPINAAIRTADPYVNIVDGSFTQSPIDPDSAVVVQGGFVFSVSGNCPDGRKVEFTVEIEDTMSSPFNQNLSYIIRAPMLRVRTILISEIDGDGDGIVDPGETLEINLEIENGGLTTASGVEGTLFPLSQEIQLLETHADFGDVGYGEVVASSNGYVVKMDSAAGENSSYFIALRLASSHGYLVSRTIPLGTGAVSFYDRVTGIFPEWEVSGTTDEMWHRSANRSHPPGRSASWKSGGRDVYAPVDTLIDDYLTTPAMTIGAGYVLAFWHYANMDADTFPTYTLAGGQVLVNTADSTELLQPDSGYSHVFGDSLPIPSEFCFSGRHGWELVQIDLAAYENRTASFSFRFAAAAGTSDEGWYIDDIFVGGADFVPVGVSSPERVPVTYYLAQNYPNPFNPSTVIEYQLPRPARVKLTVYNLLGQSVATLIDGQMNAGYHKVKWDASAVASGIYFYRLRAGDFVDTKKLVILK